MIAFDAAVCRNLDVAAGLEWLETNGLGGFASGTIAGANTRRYHGLLVAATNPPGGRYVLLSKLEATLVASGKRFELAANYYPGVVHPRGFEYLQHFELDPGPVFTFECDGIRVVQRVIMRYGENTTVVEYTVEGAPSGATLEVRPLIAFRGYHDTTHANPALDGTVAQEGALASVCPYQGLPRLYFAHNARELRAESGWYYNFEYPRERERGLDFREDLYSPFAAVFDASARAVVIASTLKHQASESGQLRAAERQRRAQQDVLVAAANQFLVKRHASTDTVIAGYHWFTDWGRDTLISLPGLTLVTGRNEQARGILAAWAGHASQGMLPNRYPDEGETPEYNSVDAALWFFEAARAYLDRTSDVAFVRDTLYPVLRDMIDWHLRGTRYGIRAGDDGLLFAGGPGTQLTWMDAKVGDRVATPRDGKPVEVEALWCNALRFTAALAERFSDDATRDRCNGVAARAEKSFNDQFWNAGRKCLYDVVRDTGRDDAVRPNQVIAISLGDELVSRERARAVLEVAQRELLTPYGLRTLSPHDPRYCGRYEGPPEHRDAIYHQGTVWPWLLGPFVRAHLRVHGYTADAKAHGRQWLAAFDDHLRTAGLGQVSELFDGDAPHTPRGCIAQAWSVAALLEAISLCRS